MFNGIANLLKPPGITSFAIIKKISKMLNEKKVGHIGTLDPAAAGVLGVCFGKATKVIPFLDDSRKEYICEMKLGQRTDSLDLDGRIIAEDINWNNLSAAEIKTCISSFSGQQKQVPPMFSALHYQGKRLYQLARRGIIVERKSRDIEIFKIETIKINLPFIRFKVEVSKGSYIRALVRDIGKRLNTNSVMTFLLRTKSGPFTIDNSVTFEEIKEKGQDILLKIYEPLDLPHYTVTDEEYQRAENGNYLIKNNFVEKEISLKEDDYFLLFSESKELVALSQYQIKDGYEIYQPQKVFV